MDLNAQVNHLIRASQAWIPMIMEYGSRVLPWPPCSSVGG